MRRWLPGLLIACFVWAAAPGAAQVPVFGATGDRRELFVPLYIEGGQPGDLTAESFAPRAAQYEQAFLEWSYGRLRVTVDWQPWLSVPVSSCDYLTNVNQGSLALSNAGVSVTPYQKITYFVPVGCPGFSGIANIGGRNAVLYGSLQAWEHEGGHRFGLWHAGIRELNAADDRYYLRDMGNLFDVMGGGTGINGPGRIRLGWLPSSQALDVVAPQEVVLQRLEINDPNGLKVLRMTPLAPQDHWQQLSSGPVKAPPFTRLFAELRTGHATPWVVLHGAFDANERWWHVGTVGVGTAQFGGVTIDVLEITADTARVRVTPFESAPEEPPPPPPPPPPPSDIIAPVVTLIVAQNGKSANYTLTVRATDNVAVVKTALVVDAQTVTLSPITTGWVATVSLKAKGAHLLTATAWDAAGNAGQDVRTITR